jgi:hypothetical protein
MFKNYLVIFCMLMPGFALAQDFNPKTVVPVKLAKYDFGMTLKAFKEKNKTAVEVTNTGDDFRIELKDVKAGNEFKSVTYFFDNEDNKPFYEMIIEYKTEAQLIDHCNLFLKVPNNGDEWKWTTKEGYVFKAWTFNKKLVFALALPTTEWNDSKN